MRSLGPDAATWLVAASVVGIVAYTSLTIAMRTGEVGAVTPFRYTRIVFALIAGVMVFGERPDLWTLAGSALVIVAGIAALRLNRPGRGQTTAPDSSALRGVAPSPRS